MATKTGTASSAGFDFTGLVESGLRNRGVSLSFFARLRLRTMQRRAERRRQQAGAWLDLAAAEASVSRLVNALLARHKPRISLSTLRGVLGFLCPGLYPIC